MPRWIELAQLGYKLTTDEREEARQAIAALKKAAISIRGLKLFLPQSESQTVNSYQTLVTVLDTKVNAGGAFAAGMLSSVPGLQQLADKANQSEAAKHLMFTSTGNKVISDLATLSSPFANAQQNNQGAFIAGNIAGSVALFEVGASGVKALSSATGIKALANPAVINSVTMSADTALNGIANGDSWDTVVINTVTSALSTATGTKIGNLVGGKVISALNNLGLSERAVTALAASSNGVSFAVTQSALEETKNAFMYGAEYKPDAASIAVNIITSILFGSLEAFKNNPKAAQLQNRLKQGDVSAQKETADFLNKQAEGKQDNVSPMDTQQSPTDQPLSAQELAEQYKKQWAEAQGVENNDANGYNWDNVYKAAAEGTGETTLADWANNTKDLAKTSPLKIPENATIMSGTKAAGYDQISYKWTDSGYNYEARWHTKTPGAPAGQGNTWVVSRVTQGTPTGQQRVIHILVGNTWVTRVAWQDAIRAYQNGVMTNAQEAMLKSGHWLAP